MNSRKLSADFLKKHRPVAKDFLILQLPATLGYIIVCAAATAAVMSTGIAEHEILRLPAVSALVLILVILIARVMSVYYIAPLKYMEQVHTLPVEEKEKLLQDYPNAKKMWLHRYLEDQMIFFTKTRIFVVRYKDIKGVEAKKRDLLLHIKERKEPLLLPCPSKSVAPVVFAFLRSKNPDIKIIRKETSV